jgi:hypothetical protein
MDGREDERGKTDEVEGPARCSSATRIAALGLVAEGPAVAGCAASFALLSCLFIPCSAGGAEWKKACVLRVFARPGGAPLHFGHRCCIA